MTGHVRKLVLGIRGDTMTRNGIMSSLGLKNRGNLRDNYIKPAISAGYVAMIYPTAVRSTIRSYYLTKKGWNYYQRHNLEAEVMHGELILRSIIEEKEE